MSTEPKKMGRPPLPEMLVRIPVRIRLKRIDVEILLKLAKKDGKTLTQVIEEQLFYKPSSE